jgi:hypothetical protein
MRAISWLAENRLPFQGATEPINKSVQMAVAAKMVGMLLPSWCLVATSYVGRKDC